MTRKKKILIVEPKSSGHHVSLYLRFTIQILHAANYEIFLLTTKSTVESSNFKQIKKETSKITKIYLMPELKVNSSTSMLNILISQFVNWYNLKIKFKEVIKIESPNIIYVPTIDWIAKATEILGSPFENYPFVALYMKPKHHLNTMKLGPPSRFDWLYDLLFKRLLKIPSLKSLLVIDEFFFKFSKKKYKNLLYKVRYSPDFSLMEGRIFKKIARRNLNIPKQAKVILVYGSLQLRKGIEELLAAFSSSKILSKVKIIFAGVPDQDVKNLFKTKKVKKLISKKKIFCFFKFHRPKDEQQIFAVSDIVWLGYSRSFSGSSGVLYQAIYSDLNIIGQNHGTINRKIKKYNLGVTVSIKNTKQVVKKINYLSNNLNFFLKKSFSSRKMLKELHKPANYYKVALDALQNKS